MTMYGGCNEGSELFQAPIAGSVDCFTNNVRHFVYRWFMDREEIVQGALYHMMVGRFRLSFCIHVMLPDPTHSDSCVVVTVWSAVRKTSNINIDGPAAPTFVARTDYHATYV